MPAAVQKGDAHGEHEAKNQVERGSALGIMGSHYDTAGL
jgi:hypothetical protein